MISVLWSGADILRSKMDANEYKDYLLGIVFYKYLSDSFLIKAYNLIYAVGQKVFCLETLNQLRCNCAIRCGTRSDKESHRHTMRIHGQMYLGVEPPFVRPIA